MFDSILNRSISLDNCLVIWTVTLRYVLHQGHSKLRHIQHSVFQVYAGKLNHIQRYWVSRHIDAYWETFSRNTIVYSGIFTTLCSPFNIHDLAIFGAIAYLEPGAYLKPCETLTSHIQNPAIWYYLAIFRHILNLVQHLHTQKPSILEILEYSEPFHNCLPKHIRSPVILTKIYKYSDLGYL